MKNRVYTLSSSEVWALCTLVYLPMDEESILGRWLGELTAPQVDDVISGAVNTLQAKGVIDTGRGEDIIPEELLEAVTVLALSRVRLTAGIERDGIFTYTHFGQLEDTVVQYDIEGDSIKLHVPEQTYNFSAVLVPEWFQVEFPGELKDNMPFGAFVMLQSALQLDTIKAVLDESDWGPVFSRSELIDAFSDEKDWIDFYSAVGIGEIQPVSKMPIKDYFEHLHEHGYLQQAGSDSLQLGPAASSLQAVYGDPDRCVVTLSMDGISHDRPTSGALIFGGGRLILMRMDQAAVLSLEQLSSSHAALGWVSDLISRASTVRAVVPDPPDIESLQRPSLGPSPTQVSPQVDDGFQALPSYSEPVQAYTPERGVSQVKVPSYAQPRQPASPAQQISEPPPYNGAPVYPPYVPPKKKRRSGCLIAAVVGIVLMLCVGLIIGGAVLIFGMTLPWNPMPDPNSISQPSGQAPVWVVNSSNNDICYFYISTTGDQDWGPDQLGAQETIPPGGTWTGSAAAGAMYDLGAFDCEGNQLGAQYGVTLTAEGVTFTLNP